jgi:hypothetical protein
MNNLEVVEGRVLRQNLFEKRSQAGNVPLTVAQVVDERFSVS